MSTSGKGPFSPRTLPWVLLALSLALNAFFVGGHLYTETQLAEAEGSTGERTRLVAERLDLDPGQTAALRTMRSRIEAARIDFGSASSRHADAIWSELAEPEPNMAVIDKHLDRFWDARKSLLETNLSAARDFLEQLSSEQRRAFVSLSRQADDTPIGTRMERQ